MKHRATSILFAVVASGSTVVAADPSAPTTPGAKAEQPRTLATGAPACGNVMFKTYGPPPRCDRAAAATAIVAGILEDAARIRRALAGFDVLADRPLTLAEARRPGS